MPSWANADFDQFDDDMIDPGEHILQVGGQTTLLGGLRVGPGDAAGLIDATRSGQEIQNLLIGTDADLTGAVHIGRENVDAMVLGGLSVMQRLNLNAGADVSGNVGLANDLTVQGQVKAVNIDATQGNDLELGTNSQLTQDVIIGSGAQGTQTQVIGNLDVNGSIESGSVEVTGTTKLNGSLVVRSNGAPIEFREWSVKVVSDGLGEGFVNLSEVIVGQNDRGPRMHFLGATPDNGGARIDAFMNDGGEDVPADWPLMELHLNTDEGVRDVVISHRDSNFPFPAATVHVESPRLVVGARVAGELPAQVGHIDGSEREWRRLISGLAHAMSRPPSNSVVPAKRRSSSRLTPMCKAISS
ncbi:MAG: hypothetical protein FJY67_09340 [Calditrichaeota bacterium]|nr:hypothetical protein [Calditrichota bacterium]